PNPLAGFRFRSHAQPGSPEPYLLSGEPFRHKIPGDRLIMFGTISARCPGLAPGFLTLVTTPAWPRIRMPRTCYRVVRAGFYATVVVVPATVRHPSPGHRNNPRAEHDWGRARFFPKKSARPPVSAPNLFFRWFPFLGWWVLSFGAFW